MTCGTNSRQPMRALAAAIRAASSPPCHSCEQRQRCAVERLACREFEIYVVHDKFVPAELIAKRRERGELNQPRQPTREVFDSIFKGDMEHEDQS